MKFMMNGALTIGTLDGANVEIREAVGADNFFLFGLTEDEVVAQKASYDPRTVVDSDPRLARIFEAFDSGLFNRKEPGIFDMVLQAVLALGDQWMTVADLPSFIDAQEQVASLYSKPDQWHRMSIINAANSGRFSTDRTMNDYNRDIWGLPTLTPTLQAVD